LRPAADISTGEAGEKTGEKTRDKMLSLTTMLAIGCTSDLSTGPLKEDDYDREE
jgi:hypothetical protein